MLLIAVRGLVCPSQKGFYVAGNVKVTFRVAAPFSTSFLNWKSLMFEPVTVQTVTLQHAYCNQYYSLLCKITPMHLIWIRYIFVADGIALNAFIVCIDCKSNAADDEIEYNECRHIGQHSAVRTQQNIPKFDTTYY